MVTDFSVNNMRKVFGKIKSDFDISQVNAAPTDSGTLFIHSKGYLKFLKLNYKTVEAINSSPNMQYFKKIESTGGDYAKRRNTAYHRDMKAHVDWVLDKINETPSLMYSFLKTFTDCYNILNDSKWKAAFKRAYKRMNEKGANKTLASGVFTMYESLVLSAESMLIKTATFEYNLYAGYEPIEAVVKTEEDNRSYMNEVFLTAVKMTAMCENIKDPVRFVDDIITAEDKAEADAPRSREGWNQAYLSAEGVFTDAFAKIAKHILPAMLSAGFAAFALFHSALIAIGLVFVIFAIPLAKTIIYYSGIAKIDYEKEMHLEEELIHNNIADLKEQLEKATSEQEKKRLEQIIWRQEKMYEALIKAYPPESEVNYNDAVSTEEILTRDEDEVDAEVAQSHTDDDGQTEKDSSDYEIFI